LEFSDTELSANLHFIYPLLCDLSLSPSPPLRRLVRLSFLRIGKSLIPKISTDFSSQNWEIPDDDEEEEPIRNSHVLLTKHNQVNPTSDESDSKSASASGSESESGSDDNDSSEENSTNTTSTKKGKNNGVVI